MTNSYFDTSNQGTTFTTALCVSAMFLSIGCAIYLNTGVAYTLFDTLAYELQTIAQYKMTG